MYGYALALRCRLREEPWPKWRRHLKAGVRGEFKAGYRFLVAEERKAEAGLT